jgi:hypothetical protein
MTFSCIRTEEEENRKENLYLLFRIELSRVTKTNEKKKQVDWTSVSQPAVRPFSQAGVCVCPFLRYVLQDDHASQKVTRTAYKETS